MKGALLEHKVEVRYMERGSTESVIQKSLRD